MEYTIKIKNEKDEEFSKFLHTKIRKYNNHSSIHHREIRKPESVQMVNIIIENTNNEWIGGLTAEIYWNWLEIKYFWLDNNYRKQGIGTKVLEEVEKIAILQGCEKAFLSTFEFQGRTFYEKSGYIVVGMLDDYPPGSTFYWMSKKLL